MVSLLPRDHQQQRGSKHCMMHRSSTWANMHLLRATQEFQLLSCEACGEEHVDIACRASVKHWPLPLVVP